MPESASRGGGVSAPGGLSAPGGVCSGGVCLLWGVSAPGRGCLLQEGGVCSRGSAPGVSAPGRCLLQVSVCCWGVVCFWRGGIPACTEADTTPGNRMTDRCKNITLATTSLRPVMIPFLQCTEESYFDERASHRESFITFKNFLACHWCWLCLYDCVNIFVAVPFFLFPDYLSVYLSSVCLWF